MFMKELLGNIWMECCMYSLKLSRILAADRNRPDVVEGRHNYANWFLEEANIHHPIFIDECGFNIWTARSQGRARVGECAYRQVCGQKGRNLTICLAVSHIFGLVHYTVGMDGMTRESFTEFLADTGNHLDENENHYLIFDGAPAHRRPEQPRLIKRASAYVTTVLTIPEYCRAGGKLPEGQR